MAQIKSIAYWDGFAERFYIDETAYRVDGNCNPCDDGKFVEIKGGFVAGIIFASDLETKTTTWNLKNMSDGYLAFCRYPREVDFIESTIMNPALRYNNKWRM